jgi:transcriptional regulator with XRE-family HTH domain
LTRRGNLVYAAATMTNDSALLAIARLRRRRKQLELTLRDVAAALYGPDRANRHEGKISRFERGLGPLPGQLTPADYEAALDTLERAQIAAAERAAEEARAAAQLAADAASAAHLAAAAAQAQLNAATAALGAVRRGS